MNGNSSACRARVAHKIQQFLTAGKGKLLQVLGVSWGQGNRTCLSVQGKDWNGARAEVRVLVGIMGEARCRPSRAHTYGVELLLHQGANSRHPIPLQLNGKSNGTQLNCDCHTTAPRGKTFCDGKRNFRLIPASEREPCGKLR